MPSLNDAAFFSFLVLSRGVHYFIWMRIRWTEVLTTNGGLGNLCLFALQSNYLVWQCVIDIQPWLAIYISSTVELNMIIWNDRVNVNRVSLCHDTNTVVGHCINI